MIPWEILVREIPCK